MINVNFMKEKIPEKSTPISRFLSKILGAAFLTVLMIFVDDPVFAQGRNCGDAIDYFRVVSYANQDGNLLFTSDWVENNDDGTPNGGDIFVVTSPKQKLSMRAGFGICRSIERSIDLSAYSEAILNFKYQFNNTVSSSDNVNVYISSDGGTNFTLLDNIDPLNDNINGLPVYDITAFISSTVVVRIEACGLDGVGEEFEVLFFNISGCNEPIITNLCSDVRFEWADFNGNGQVWLRNTSSMNYSIPYPGGTLNATVTLIDPANRNGDADQHAAGVHPYDPAGGCGVITGGTDDITGNGSIDDPWDSDCGRFYTETNGGYGPDYLSWGIVSSDHTDNVTLEFCFDKQVLISDYNISDIDHASLLYSLNINPLEPPGNSYQDEVIVSAVDADGNNVPLTVTALGNGVIVSGQTAISVYDPNSATSGDLSPNDPNGAVVVNSELPIECMSISYSNGIDDALDEQNNPGLYSWWSNINGPTNGASDDQAIRVDGFSACVCPDFSMTVSNDTICEGDMATLFVESVQGGMPPYVFEWEDGSNGDSYTFTPATDVDVQVILFTDVQGCQDTAIATAFVEDCFDVALYKTLSSSGPFSSGDAVSFDITVINQGGVTAYDIMVNEYFSSSELNYVNLTVGGTTVQGNPVSIIGAGPNFEVNQLDPGDSVIVTVNFTIDANFTGSNIVNNAEIVFASDSDGGTLAEDEDSPLGNTNDGSSNELATDNDVDDDSTGGTDNPNDEDDYDPAQINISQSFDLALTKILNTGTPGPFMPGDAVSYDITVYNQGTLEAFDIDVQDYFVAGELDFVSITPAATTVNGAPLSVVGAGPNFEVESLASGDAAVVTINFTISNSFTGTSIVNNAEIVDASESNGGPTAVDEDSPLGNTNDGSTNELATDNDIDDDSTGGTDNPNDEDDYDPALISVDPCPDPNCVGVNVIVRDN